MPLRILDVGNCGPDFHANQRFLTSHFDCEVVQADDATEARAAMESVQFALVLVNRKLDVDYSDGLEVIRALKANPRTAATPVMLVTNYAEHQQAAVAIGALEGFGKLQFDDPATVAKLEPILGKAR